MKRYIKSSSSINDVIQKVQSRLEQSGVIDSVYSVDGYENYSGNYYIEVTLKPHRKKIKKTLIANKLDAYIDKLCKSLQSYLTEGDTTPREDAFIIQVTIDDLLIGYVANISQGRGQIWAYLTADPYKAERFTKAYSNMIGWVDEFMIPGYISTEYEDLHLIRDDQSDIDDLYNWVRENKGNTYHCYAFRNDVHYDYVKIDNVSRVSPISSDEFERILIG